MAAEEAAPNSIASVFLIQTAKPWDKPVVFCGTWCLLVAAIPEGDEGDPGMLAALSVSTTILGEGAR